MSFELRFPNITAQDEKGQLIQMRSYMHQLVEQLQWALNDLSSTASGCVVAASAPKSQASAPAKVDAEATFNAVKSLIIKSADIVTAYYDEINRRLEGLYVAESDFGAFAEQTSQDILQTSTGIETLYTNIQTILTDIESISHTIIETNAHINSGLLYYDEDGIPIYGLEIGQRNTVDGVEVFNKYARFTSDRLSFYDQNDTEVAYISDYKLYITNAVIRNSLKIGGYMLDTSNGLAFKWEGVI
jgi:hypothetical protein